MIALTMLWLIRNSNSMAGRILNSRAVVHIGIISYSLYLWQQLLLSGKNKSFFGEFPFNLAFLVVAAEFSYYVIERRFLGWRGRFEVPRESLLATRRNPVHLKGREEH
jgi:peptidoglycan/LPS O-acetylase OafA/YrhL